MTQHEPDTEETREERYGRLTEGNFLTRAVVHLLGIADPADAEEFTALQAEGRLALYPPAEGDEPGPPKDPRDAEIDRLRRELAERDPDFRDSRDPDFRDPTRDPDFRDPTRDPHVPDPRDPTRDPDFRDSRDPRVDPRDPTRPDPRDPTGPATPPASPPPPSTPHG